MAPRPRLDLRISPKTVQQQAVEKLRGAILAGHFKPGDRLVEGDLCAMLGVSRPSVREALRSLEAERLIAVAPNRGFFVPTMSWEEIEEIYRVRALLEGEAAALFTVRAKRPELQAMRAALDDFRAAVAADDMMEQLASTGRFYEPILAGCGNRIIQEILQGLMARITFLRSRSMSRKGRARLSLREMTRIFDAVRGSDPEAARTAAREHVEQACAAAEIVYAEKE
ncbi:GntR family transcriptional regulator [Rhodoplanes sp. TEM]|uniref:GntR family transcriptional regulator n=1 Tax=Rhodoplanes tepidamans TaxID=200616 RepID=A0ABT5J602_RHOTP|nr:MULTISPECIES: GntR family transcriptional regulator [Rhodoplanes]MDC7785085.1 GntR family transcriptional regulator [Rhodoplanes tepidamans]MDC7982559.1 GntR family transcriptional regulator [Rhodoplanes sp. TEM]